MTDMRPTSGLRKTSDNAKSQAATASGASDALLRVTDLDLLEAVVQLADAAVDVMTQGGSVWAPRSRPWSSCALADLWLAWP